MEIASDPEPALAERAHSVTDVIGDRFPGLAVGDQLGVGVPIRRDCADRPVLDQHVARVGRCSLDPDPRLAPADVEHRRVVALEQAVERRVHFPGWVDQFIG